jgi:hypothetical protein
MYMGEKANPAINAKALFVKRPLIKELLFFVKLVRVKYLALLEVPVLL